MKVKLRHSEEREASDFAEVANQKELRELFGFIYQSGGIYSSEHDDLFADPIYNIVDSGSSAYIEITYGHSE